MYRIFFSKIIKDLLIALIATYFFLLIPELILPGIVNSHFDLKYLLIFVLLLGLLFSKIGKNIKKPENPKFRAISLNLTNIILFIIALMLVLSLYKMKVWEIAVIITLSIPLLISAENILIRKK